MDITGIDIVALSTGFASFCGTIGAVLKAFKSEASAKAAEQQTVTIQIERKAQSEFRDAQVQEMRTEIAVLKHEQQSHSARLDEGQRQFDSLSKELKEQNGLLREVLGALRMKFNLPLTGTQNSQF